MGLHWMGGGALAPWGPPPQNRGKRRPHGAGGCPGDLQCWGPIALGMEAVQYGPKASLHPWGFVPIPQWGWWEAVRLRSHRPGGVGKGLRVEGGGGPGTGGKPGRGGGSRWRQVDFNTGVGPGPRGVCAAPVSHGCAAGSTGCPGAAGAWPGAKAAPSPASKRCRRPSPKAPCPVPLPSGPELRVPPAAFRPHSSAWARGCRVPVL